MTPLANLLSRIMPRALIAPVLATIYAAMIVGVVLTSGSGRIDIAYIDVSQ
jgi:hypothetical protein